MTRLLVISSIGSALFCLITCSYFKKFETVPVIVSVALAFVYGVIQRSGGFVDVTIQLTVLTVFWLLALEDIGSLSVKGWEIAAFGISVAIARVFLRIPPALNLVSVGLAAVLFGVPYLVTRGKGMGLGDGLVFALFAVLLTPVETVVLFLMTVVSATVYALAAFAVRKKIEPFALLPFVFYSALVYLPLKTFWIAKLGMQAAYAFQWML